MVITTKRRQCQRINRTINRATNNSLTRTDIRRIHIQRHRNSQRTTTHSNKVTTTTQIPNQQRKQRNNYRLINRTRHPPPRQRRMSIQRIAGQQVRHRHTIRSQVQTRYSLRRTLTRERNGHHRLRGSTHFLIALNKTQIIMIMSFYILQQQQNSVEITYRIQPHDTYKDRES